MEAQNRPYRSSKVDEVVDSIDVDVMTTQQKVQLFIFVFFAKFLS